MSKRRESSVNGRIRRGRLKDLIARENQFAHQVHHAIQKGDIDTDGAFSGGVGGSA